ncbi:hypothetical protein QTP70_028992 [Hemibagrus guttatus]|uniref:Opioid growth factor receptor (OGFr) conserved domain-containing protein n=1 Tax=Hemibagrus guttatus TaxID=175788 RepID=A0AAE0UNK1_9TELE|nr:hypothetical protein QTP70_028992 [Hemibagrus guttatus]
MMTKTKTNLRFYRNQKKFKPDGVYIDDFHKHWFGDYHNLEYVHSYIQWLFPIQEKGLNFASRELSLTEIKASIELFCEDEEMKKRLLTSYKLMLDFYGIQLVNEDTGEVRRAENWRDRFENLNRFLKNKLYPSLLQEQAQVTLMKIMKLCQDFILSMLQQIKITQFDDEPDDKLDNDKVWPNLQFYRNKIPFRPDGICIEDFHMHWFGDYDRLEHVHCYIQ